MVQGEKLWNRELGDWVPLDVLAFTSLMTLGKSHCLWALVSFWTTFSECFKKGCNFPHSYLLYWRRVYCVCISPVLLLLSVNVHFPCQPETFRGMGGIFFIFISLAPSTVPDSRKLSVNVCCVAGKGVPQSWLPGVHIFCLFPL